jgi:hypothetical protein
MAKIRIARGHECRGVGKNERRLLIETPHGNLLLVEGADGPHKWEEIESTQLSAAEAAESWEKELAWLTSYPQSSGGGWMAELQDPGPRDLELLWTKGRVRFLLEEGADSEEEALRRACRWVLENLAPESGVR